MSSLKKLSSAQFFSLVRMLFGLWLIQHFFFLIPYGRELYSSEGIKVAGGALYLKDFLSPLRSALGIQILLTLSLVSSLLFTFKIKRAMNSLFFSSLGFFFFIRIFFPITLDFLMLAGPYLL